MKLKWFIKYCKYINILDIAIKMRCSIERGGDMSNAMGFYTLLNLLVEVAVANIVKKISILLNLPHMF